MRIRILNEPYLYSFSKKSSESRLSIPNKESN